jgi:hypothetical protein
VILPPLVFHGMMYLKNGSLHGRAKRFPVVLLVNVTKLRFIRL